MLFISARYLSLYLGCNSKILILIYKPVSNCYYKHGVINLLISTGRFTKFL